MRKNQFFSFSIISPKEPDIMIKLLTCTLLSLVAILDAASLPTYLTLCKITHPNLNECIKKNGNKAIRDIVKGDVHYDIPSALPLKVQGPIVSKYNKQEIVVTDVEIHGLESTNITDVEFNTEKGSFKMNMTVPLITALGKCHVVGSNIGSNTELLNEKFIGANLNYISDFSIEEIDGEMYFTKFEHYERLRSQEQFNEFIGAIGALKVSKTVCQERFPTIIEQKLGDYVFNTYKGLADRVPSNDFFKP